MENDLRLLNNELVQPSDIQVNFFSQDEMSAIADDIITNPLANDLNNASQEEELFF